MRAAVFIAVNVTLRVMCVWKLDKWLANEVVPSRERNVMDFPRLA